MKRWRTMSNPERVEALIELLPYRLSSTEIAARLAADSKNVILGFARRNGISLRRGVLRPIRITRDYSPRATPRAKTTAEKDQAVQEFLSSLPRDTRNFTARFCGDPPYHRSALAKKRGAWL